MTGFLENSGILEKLFGSLAAATAPAPAPGERQTVAGDPNNPTAANAAYMSDPVMQEKTRVNKGGRS